MESGFRTQQYPKIEIGIEKIGTGNLWCSMCYPVRSAHSKLCEHCYLARREGVQWKSAWKCRIILPKSWPICWVLLTTFLRCLRSQKRWALHILCNFATFCCILKIFVSPCVVEGYAVKPLSLKSHCKYSSVLNRGYVATMIYYGRKEECVCWHYFLKSKIDLT